MITDKYNTIFGLFVYVCTIYPESSSQNVQPPPLPCPVAAVLHTWHPRSSMPGTRDHPCPTSATLHAQHLPDNQQVTHIRVFPRVHPNISNPLKDSALAGIPKRHKAGRAVLPRKRAQRNAVAISRLRKYPAVKCSRVFG